jgi:malate dehydrogenase (oxaloacetate-decarboxylating)(NADP+)
LRLVGKNIAEIKLVCSDAGAAALACLDLIASPGLGRENIRVTDRKGVVYVGRKEDMDANKGAVCRGNGRENSGRCGPRGDVFLGLSAAAVLKADRMTQMARDPLIFAMANPTPEVMPEDALAVRPDAIIGIGRSDYPNQINNVLCFPLLSWRARLRSDHDR